MPGAKLIVIYPRPADIEAFDKCYQEEHVILHVPTFRPVPPRSEHHTRLRNPDETIPSTSPTAYVLKDIMLSSTYRLDTFLDYV